MKVLAPGGLNFVILVVPKMWSGPMSKQLYLILKTF